MNLELLVIPLILIFSFLLLLRDKRAALVLLMILSMFLHKEVFSIYRWDVLPIRIFMLSLLAFILIQSAMWIRKSRSLFVVQDKIQEYLQDPFLLSISLLWLIRGISIIYSKNIAASLFLFVFFTTIVALGYFVYLNFKADAQIVLSFVTTYIRLAFIACLFGFFQLYLFYFQDLTIGALWSVPGRLPRVGSVFWDVNHFGGFVASLMSVLGVLILVEKTWKGRLVNGTMFSVMLISLLMTSSRTAWMLAFFSFITFALTLLVKKFRYKGLLGLLIVILLAVAPLIYQYNIKSSPFRAYVKDYFHYRIDSFDSHLLLLRGTIAVFSDNPYLGGGYGGFFEHFITTDVASEYLGRDPAGLNTRVPAHTLWGEQLAETGIIGFSVFLLYLFVVVGTVFYASFNSTDRKEVLITAAMGSTLVGYLIAGIFYSYKSEFFYLVTFLYFTYAVAVLRTKFIFSNILSFYFRAGKWVNIVLALTSFILIFVGLGSTHLIPWDEAIYAKVAKNILVSGDFMSLRWWPNTLWFEKPPLMFWLMAVSMKLFGITSFAIRLPSAILGLGTVFITYVFGSKLYNKTVGALSALVLVTTFQFLYYARTSMLDVSLTFFITTALYFYWISQQDLKKRYWFITGIFIGFAVLVKGVVGFLPFLVIFMHQAVLLLTKKETLDKNKFIGLCLATFSSLLVFVPWHLYMFYLYGNSFYTTYIGYHVLERASHGIEDKGRPWYWYFIVLKVSMRVWFVALILAFPITFINTFTSIRRYIISKTKFRVYSYKKDLFLVIYILCIFTFFAVAKSKLVWYIIPLYPALSILVGLFIERVIRTVIPKNFILKFIAIYTIFVGSLFYLFLERSLVYTGDLTYKQAELIELKDELHGVETKLYADRIELPLLLFYSDGPFEVVDFGPLGEVLKNTTYSEDVVFITKESRFRSYNELYPELDMEDRRDEWVLGYKPSQYRLDTEMLDEISKEISNINVDIANSIEKSKTVSPSTYAILDRLMSEQSELNKKIQSSLAQEALSVENVTESN